MSSSNRQNRCNELIQIIGLNQDHILNFNFKPNKLMQANLILKNISKNKIAYKFKTTNPKCYSVQPNQSIIAPYSELAVEFTMQPRSEFKEGFIGDRFLIDIAELTDEILQIEEDTGKILKEHQSGNKRIEVELLKSQQSMEKSQDIGNKGVQLRENAKFNETLQGSLYNSVQNEEEKRLNDLLSKTKNDNILLQQQCKELEKKVKELSKAQEANNSEANFTMFHVIIIAILGLIAGAFLTK